MMYVFTFQNLKRKEEIERKKRPIRASELIYRILLTEHDVCFIYNENGIQKV